MMGNCKDCKFWEYFQDTRGRKWHECHRVSWLDFDVKVEESNFAIYAHSSDDYGLEAGLKTGPMFGCVQFVSKKRGR